ncbi:MAG: citramalate synthase [Clostridia bacterium]|nr:citramalate synthase [Clostridia bacterium]
MKSNRIEVLDTTLRDGAQAEGISFSLEDKLKIVHALDELGVDFIEAGNPAANPKDAALFASLRQEVPLRNARLAAFGATRRGNIRCEDDVGLAAILACGARVATIFGKSSAFHVDKVLRVSRQENLAMIGETVAYLIANGMTVYYDAEHFFDGYREEPEYALETLRAAARAGVAGVALCDTNGGSLPWQIAEGTTAAIHALSGAVRVGIHAHNDSGLAVANTLEAVRTGATHIQGTINGLGERCGNANLCAALPCLHFKMGFEVLKPGAFARLSDTARYVSEIANVALDERSPYVGDSAFAHKGGMHVDGVRKVSASFEHIDPELVGNRRRVLLSEVSGRAALMDRLAPLLPGLDAKSPEVAALVDVLKQREAEGYSYEDAEGSFALLALDTFGRRQRYFEALDFRVTADLPGQRLAQAVIKLAVSGREEITAAEGDGPVNAMDSALRKALGVFFPQIARVRLTDYKVRVLDSRGTGSTTRVQMTSTDGRRVWGTTGVSTNIIDASWRALADAIDYWLAFCRE